MKKNPYWLYLFVALNFLFAITASYASQSSTVDNAPVILVLGDSISASFGIQQSQGWVALLEKKLQNNRYPFRVVNASISGETTQGGLQRLPDLVDKYHPAIIIIELGGNDGLRGLNIALMKNNLQSMIAKATAANASILLAGIRLPPNYGHTYTEQFHQTYIDLAQTNKIPLVPFILDNIAINHELMQEDGIHPTAKAQPIMLNNVWDKLKPLLDKRY